MSEWKTHILRYRMFRRAAATFGRVATGVAGVQVIFIFMMGYEKPLED